MFSGVQPEKGVITSKAGHHLSELNLIIRVRKPGADPGLLKRVFIYIKAWGSFC